MEPHVGEGTEGTNRCVLGRTWSGWKPSSLGGTKGYPTQGWRETGWAWPCAGFSKGTRDGTAGLLLAKGQPRCGREKEMDPLSKTFLHWNIGTSSAIATVQESFGAVPENEMDGTANTEVVSTTGRAASYQ
mmetsp:Transcript_8343/g.52027  ORF Transcript_8343/g.52027 Transcript_8343/m.52027 type:complete len:131 (+) Transcript_8343:97-489(+)